MKFDDRGTPTGPWVCFSGDWDTGVLILNGKLVLIVDAIEIETPAEFLKLIYDKGHIDASMRVAILGALAAGDSIFGAIARRFMRGG